VHEHHVAVDFGKLMYVMM